MNTAQLDQWNKDLEGKQPQEIIRFFLEKFGDKIAFASSLGAEDQVITEMIANCGVPGKSLLLIQVGYFLRPTI